MFRRHGQPLPKIGAGEKCCGYCGTVIKGFGKLKECPIKNCWFVFAMMSKDESKDDPSGFGRCEFCSAYSPRKNLCCEECGKVDDGAVAREKQIQKGKKRKAEFEKDLELKKLRAENDEFRRKEAEAIEDQRLSKILEETERNTRRNAESEERKKLKEQIEKGTVDESLLDESSNEVDIEGNNC